MILDSSVRSECWTSELTDSESPVRAASGARYLLLTGMVSGPGDVNERGGTCPAKCSTLNSAGYLKFPDRTVAVKTNATTFD